jgi:hypothetical protein
MVPLSAYFKGGKIKLEIGLVSGKMVPGSIEVTVYADEAGDKYNQKLADLGGDFKIPGLKGSPRYDAFYARLKTDITGGFKGVTKKISPETSQAAEVELQKDLKEAVMKEVSSIKPESRILFTNSYFWNFDKLQITSSASTTADLSQHVSFYAILINSSKLAKYIAEQKLSSYDGAPVDLLWSPDDLKTEFSTKSGDISKLWTASDLNLKLTGQVSLVWVLDTGDLQKAIAGINKKDVESKISANSNISKVIVEISPFWKKTLPANPKNIKIKIDQDL